MTDGTIGGRLKADLLWASGWAGLCVARGRGPSAMIGFERVRPKSREAFQPRRHLDITPQRLDRLIRTLKRWRVDIVSIDEAWRAPRRHEPRSASSACRSTAVMVTL